MATDRTSVMLERLVGLPAIRVLDVERDPLLRITVETRTVTPPSCPGCTGQAALKTVTWSS